MASHLSALAIPVPMLQGEVAASASESSSSGPTWNLPLLPFSHSPLEDVQLELRKHNETACLSQPL